MGSLRLGQVLGLQHSHEDEVTVAEVRRLNVASAFAISDSLADLVWNPQFHGPQVAAGLITLYEAALSALQANPDEDAGIR